jgi:GMP synthase-like glutamine amidotransferase
MKQFLVLQHTYSEFLGTVEKQLENRGIGFIYCRPFTGQAVPGSALQYDALWLLGGAWPVTDLEHCPWIEDELRLIAAFRRAKRPVVGIGFGGLLVAQAFGGVPRAEPMHRAYWTTARATVAGRGDPVADAVDGARVLVMVNGGVELPAGVEPLVTGEAGEWLALRSGEAYALLFRPEIKPGTIEDMIMEEGRQLPDHVGELLAEARMQWPETQRVTDRVIVGLVAALDLMRERRKPPVFALTPVTRDP